MKEDKMHLINKLFNNETIRTVWDKEDEKYYVSVVDVVGILSSSDNPRNYWKVLKHRLKKEGNESVTNCNQLKLKSSDAKNYKTDVVDIEDRLDASVVNSDNDDRMIDKQKSINDTFFVDL